MGVLYVGVDDSNHAGTAKGEVVLAVFSSRREDAIVSKFPNSRNYARALEWASDSQRGYRFTLLCGECWRRSSGNLVTATPFLVSEYLKTNAARKFDSAKIYLDGIFSVQGAEHIKRTLDSHLKVLSVEGFTKKRKTTAGYVQKRPYCPPVVYFADVLASNKFKEPMEKLMTDDNFSPFPCKH